MLAAAWLAFQGRGWAGEVKLGELHRQVQATEEA